MIPPVKKLIKAVVEEMERCVREEMTLSDLKARCKYHLLKNYEYEKLLGKEKKLEDTQGIENTDDKNILKFLLLQSLSTQLDLLKKIDQKTSVVALTPTLQLPPLVEKLKKKDFLAVALNKQFKGELRNKTPWTGTGLWLNPSGYRYAGAWQEGNFEGEIKHANGTLWKGQLLSKKLWSGQGMLILFDRTCYEGKWRDGHFNGTVKHPNGTLWTGEMREYKPWNGQGKFVNEDGQTEEGEWLKGYFKSS